MSPYALSNDALWAIAKKAWPASQEWELRALWQKLLPVLRAKEQELSKMMQNVFSASPGGLYEDICGYNPHEGSQADWWKAEPRKLESHSNAVREFAATLYNQFGEIPLRQKAEREAKAKAAHEASAKAEQERRDKLKAAFRESALTKFVRAGGNPTDFDEAFPRIWLAHLERCALDESPEPKADYMRQF